MPGQKRNTLTGYILAGGKSSRMGTDKGLMVIGGKMMIEHAIEQLKPAVHELVIVSNNREYEQFGHKIISDPIKDIGPAGGIHASLSHTGTTQNFILGCDMPFVTTEAIDFFIQHAASAEIVLPVHGGRLEPLFGIYSKACLPRWNAYIQQGFLKLHMMAAGFDLLRIETAGNPLFREPFFVNINTKEEFEKALTIKNL